MYLKTEAQSEEVDGPAAGSVGGSAEDVGESAGVVGGSAVSSSLLQSYSSNKHQEQQYF